MRELADLWRTSALLSWDQQTMMPPRGAEGRARATATLRVISHQKLVDPALGELLDEAAADSLDPPRAAMVRVLRRERDQSVRLPDDFVRRLALAVVARPGRVAGRRAGTTTGSRSGRASRRWCG